MNFEPNNEQKAAIYSKPNLLVAAAAGSGKTAVLVERVAEKLLGENDSCNADELLIVTFTNAAAEEMRSRIEKRLEEELGVCVGEDESAYEKRARVIEQKRRLSGAEICTIDSFCIDLVRDNFELAGVTPDFKISDGADLDAINKKCITEIFLEYLNENNPDFSLLLDLVGTEYSEKSFIDFVCGIYDYSRQLPFPKKWFSSLADNYKAFEKGNPWYDYAFCTAVSVLKDTAEALYNCETLLNGDEAAIKKYGAAVAESISGVEELQKKAATGDWDIFYSNLSSFSFAELAKGTKGEAEEVKTVKSIYKTVKDSYFERLNKIFFADKRKIEEQSRLLYPAVKVLSDILIEFDGKVFEEYKKANVFTFHNTEHLALEILCEEVDGEVRVKPCAEEISAKYKEIMVDEYQDTNDMQDLLFNILSNGGEKLFVVGDVKQSIYSFRGANPSNFLNKKITFLPYEESGDRLENQPKKIILGNNYRSRETVCNYVNFFFGLFMNEQTGSIVYDDSEKLIPAAKFPVIDGKTVELDVIESAEFEEDDCIVQADRISEYIRQMMSKGNILRAGNEEMRCAEYSDFAILMRNLSSNAQAFAKRLRDNGIPIEYVNDSFIDTIEVSTVVSLLKVTDNPNLDVELLTVMLSPIFGFSYDEIAVIRAQKRDGTIYSSVVFAANNGNVKADEFVKRLQELRLFSVSQPLSKFVTDLVYTTGYLDIVSSLPGGSIRRNNLLLLCNLAADYSADSFPTVSGFIKYLDNRSAKMSGAAGFDGKNAVKLMSMHKSKGLQFPVCIIAGTSSKFNNSEVRQTVNYSTKLGIGFKYYDEISEQKVTSAARECLIDSSKTSGIEEELRVLYVAMTRAEEYLYFVGNAENFAKKITKLKNLIYMCNGQLNTNVLCNTSSFLEWLLLSALCCKGCSKLLCDDSLLPFLKGDSGLDVKLISNIEKSANVTDKGYENTVNFDVNAMTNAFGYKYPFEDILNVESKTSVTEIVHKSGNEEFNFTQRPSFMAKDGLNSAEKGTAMHKALEHFDFSKSYTADEIETELQRLYEWQFISEYEYNSVNRNDLKRFFASDIYKRISACENVKREMRFVTEASATKLYKNLDPKFKDETVIIQGAIDLCFIEDGKVVIVDFKTDKSDNAESFRQRYSLQLEIYADAASKIFGLPVGEKIIYSLYCGKEIKL